MGEPSTSSQPIAFEIPKMIVPDKILQQQKCSECLNYLSVGPVMMTSENKTICGRCVQIHPKKETLKKSMYDYVAQALIFKCIHHFEGCRDLVPYVKICDKNQHEMHEDICTFRQTNQSIDCGECSFKAENGVQLVSHLKQCHPQVVVENNFSYTLGDEFKGLLHDQDFLFNIKIDSENNVLKVLVSPYVTTKTHNNDFEKRLLKLKLSDLKTEIIHSFKFFESIEIDVGHLKHILDQIQEVFVEVTFNQHNMLEEKLYKSKLMLLDAQEKCLGYSKLQDAVRKQLDLHCVTLFTCNDNCKNHDYTNIDLFKSMYAHFPKMICAWEGCNETLEITKYPDHQRSCKFRKYYCPVDECDFVGYLNSFSQHFFSHITNNGVSVSLNQSENINFLNTNTFYWVLDIQLMDTVAVNYSYSSNQLQINMEKCPMLVKNYQFTIYRSYYYNGSYSITYTEELRNWNSLINKIYIRVNLDKVKCLTLRFIKR